MGLKLQMFLQSDEGYGWSEHWSWTGTTDPNLLVVLFNTFTDKRVNLLTNDCQVIRIRLESDFKRDPMIFALQSYANNRGRQPEKVNNLANAVLLRSEAPGIGYNRVFLRGVPDSMVVANQFIPDASWQTAFNSFRTFVRDSGNFDVDASVDNPQTPIPVASVSMSNPRGIRLVANVGMPIPASGQVRIKGASVVGYNGIKNIVRPPTATEPEVTLLGGARPQQDNPTSDMVTVTPIEVRAGAMTQLFIEGFTQRRVGRFFGQQAGRARTQLSLRP